MHELLVLKKSTRASLTGMGDCDRRLFHGLSAWFSSSVRDRRRQLWENGGGELTPFDEAQFLFSENSESEDTKKIFESEAYLQEHLAVFHSLYIDRCRDLGNRADVKLGDYFLPPSDIQAMVKKQMRYKWELDQPDSGSESSAPNEDLQQNQKEHQTMETHSDRYVAPEELPSTSTDDGFVDVKDLPKYSGPLTEFLPGKEGFEVISVR